MDKYINQFPEQLHEAIRIGGQIPPMGLSTQIQQIIITGMGGSGIGGALVKELTRNSLPIPLEVNSDYELPAYAGEKTLVICSSYSGNTEETLSAFEQAVAKKCRIICITTGGKLQQRAAELNIPFILIPGGMPPRTCLGYSLVVQICILIKGGWLGEEMMHSLKHGAEYLSAHQDKIKHRAQLLAEAIAGTMPVIYSGVANAAIAMRWKQQINENAKMHAFTHTVPEMNHNELVAYHFADPHLSVLFLEDAADHPQIKKRFEWCAATIAPQVHGLHRIAMEGHDAFSKMMEAIHFGDWLSYYLSVKKQVDPIQIDILNQLKKALES